MSKKNAVNKHHLKSNAQDSLKKHSHDDLQLALVNLSKIKSSQQTIENLTLQKMLNVQEQLGRFKLENQYLQEELDNIKKNQIIRNNTHKLDLNLNAKNDRDTLNLKKSLDSALSDNQNLKKQIEEFKQKNLEYKDNSKLKLENIITRQNMMKLQETLVEYNTYNKNLQDKVNSLKNTQITHENYKKLESENNIIHEKLINSKNEFEHKNKIALTTMFLTQEMLNSYEIENKNLKKEIESNKLVNVRNNQLMLENKKLKDQIAALEKNKLNEQKLQLLEKEKKFTFLQLLNVQEELSESRVENNILKNKVKKLTTQQNTINLTINSQSSVTSKNPEILLFGAPNRIKSELPYQIGQTMIEKSKNLNDSIKMPYIIYKKIKEESQKETSNLPPISEYADINDAEKVKRHLSYRLGNTVINSINSPKETLKLPLKIGIEILKFKLKS
ncbi:hypothetical protein B9T31_06920 [Acinetobacter sp. ANC 4558]|uniref:hypothetical protein n=1 Tax=Acinetobacter sp. ANC 4558 TaxID=1977876 RepID=UPI000A34589C|nr:hypothetical protein [Acinetobacter sp. ANC 4558]OTG86722.1 hypothetical protein B9T31_06920 [Acinetobacter sp. ANC 4558]